MSDQQIGLSIVERRRAIYQRAIARFEARGTPIDRDPRFAAIIESWITGHAEMADVAKAYNDLRRSSLHRGGSSGEPPKAVQEIAPSEDKQFEDLDRVIHPYQPES